MRLLLILGTWACMQAQDFPDLVDRAVQPDFWPDVQVVAAQVDVAGDVYLAGNRFSAIEFAGAKRFGAPLTNNEGDLFVVKMDAQLQRVIYATVIGGSRRDTISSMKVDSLGNVFLAGFSESSDFPFTGAIASGGSTGGFALKLTTSGTVLSYAVRLGQDSYPIAVDVDSTGAAYLGGSSGAATLPTTVGSYQPFPRGTPALGVSFPFALKLTPAGSLDFVTSAGTTGGILDAFALLPDGKLVLLSRQDGLLVLNASGSRLEFSKAFDGIVPARKLGVDLSGLIYVSGGQSPEESHDLQRFRPDGTSPGTIHFAGGPSLEGILVGPDGSVYEMSNPFGPGFPTRNAVSACIPNVKQPIGSAGLLNGVTDHALVVIAPDGGVRFATFFPAFFSIKAVSPDNRYAYAISAQYQSTGSYVGWSGLLRIDLSKIPSGDPLTPACLGHGATYEYSGLAPGGIMTLYGSNLGPKSGVSFTLRDGKVPAELAGVQMTVDGKSAPVLYAQESQVNFVVPWSTNTSGVVRVCISRTTSMACLDATGAPAAPGFFGLAPGQPIVANVDGTLNTVDNPVKRGGFVTLYLTGTGALEGSREDGSVSGEPLQHVLAPSTASVQGNPITTGCGHGAPSCGFESVPAVLTYVGAAPGMVSGVTQLNVRIPEDSLPGARGLDVLFSLPMNQVAGHIAATIHIAQ